MKIAIVGFGREGRSLLAYLRNNARYRTAEISVLDKNNISRPRGADRVVTGPHYLRDLTAYDLVFRSPGAPWMLPEFVRARRRGVKFSSATKLFFAEARRRGVRLVGITGTKGKGTTATLLYTILKAAKRLVHLAGNIGLPALDILSRIKKGDIVILELSSFQLQDLGSSPHFAAVLEMFPDHLDAHRSLAEYYGAKAVIARYQRRSDTVFFPAHDATSRRIARSGAGKKIAVDWRTWTLFGPGDLAMAGIHNFRNAVLAARMAQALGIPDATIVRTIKKFPGLAHRAELVRTIRGVRFYDDSASTNPATAAAAIASFPPATAALIAGGYDKGLSYKPLADAIRRTPPRLVVLIGENAPKIKKALGGTRVPVVHATSLADAVRQAYRAARCEPPGAVLLSPGAASFDMFKNYADRGERFTRIVRHL